MIFTQKPSFFDAIQAGIKFYRHRRLPSPAKPEGYHRMFGRTNVHTDPTRDWPQVLCSCSGQKPHCSQPDVDDEVEDVTPKKSSGFLRPHRSSLDFQKPIKESPKKLTTTIEKSNDDSDVEEDHFAAHMNLDQFAPSEITIQVLEDPNSSKKKSRKRTLEVRGRHSDHEGDDESEYECLEYVKRLSLPHGVQPDQLRCTWDSSTGHVVVEAPIIDLEPIDREATSSPRTIPVRVIKSADQEEGARYWKRARYM